MKCKQIAIRSHKYYVEYSEHKSLCTLKRLKHININFNNMKKNKKGNL